MARAFDDADCRSKYETTLPAVHNFGLHSFACIKCEKEIEQIKFPSSDRPLIEEPVTFVADQLTLARKRDDLLKWVPVLKQVLRLKAAWRGRVDWAPAEDKGYEYGVWKQEHNVDFSKTAHTNIGRPSSWGPAFYARLEVGQSVAIDGEGFPRHAAAFEEPFGCIASVEDGGDIIVRTSNCARANGSAMWVKLRQREIIVDIPAPMYRLDPSAAKNGLYGFVPSVTNKWCKFKGCGIITEGSHLCPKHLGELAKLEGGPGIAPKHRYVTQGAAHKNVIVTVDVGADWE